MSRIYTLPFKLLTQISSLMTKTWVQVSCNYYRDKKTDKPCAKQSIITTICCIICVI